MEDFLNRLASLAQLGPLGALNMRNNKGRSALVAGTEESVSGEQVSRRSIVVAAGGKHLQHKENVGDALAQSVSLSLSYAHYNPANASAPVWVRGLLQWGTDGHQVEARFDWLAGTMIRACGAGFRLTAEAAPDPLTGAYPEGSIARVGAVIGYGQIGTLAPTLTQWIPDLPPGGTQDVEVPAFARKLIVLTDAPYSLAYGTQLPVAGANVLTTVLSTASDQPHQVGGGAPFIRITNGAVGAATFGLVWRLDL